MSLSSKKQLIMKRLSDIEKRRSEKETEKILRLATDTLKKELTELLDRCPGCEHNGNCERQKTAQRNLDFSPVDGQYHDWLE